MLYCSPHILHQLVDRVLTVFHAHTTHHFWGTSSGPKNARRSAVTFPMWPLTIVSKLPQRAMQQWQEGEEKWTTGDLCLRNIPCISLFSFSFSLFFSKEATHKDTVQDKGLFKHIISLLRHERIGDWRASHADAVEQRTFTKRLPLNLAADDLDTTS